MKIFKEGPPDWKQLQKCLHNQRESVLESAKVYANRFKVAMLYGIWCDFTKVSEIFQEFASKHNAVENQVIYNELFLCPLKRVATDEESLMALQNRAAITGTAVKKTAGPIIAPKPAPPAVLHVPVPTQQPVQGQQMPPQPAKPLPPIPQKTTTTNIAASTAANTQPLPPTRRRAAANTAKPPPRNKVQAKVTPAKDALKQAEVREARREFYKAIATEYAIGKVPGDHNCFYYAIAAHVYPDEYKKSHFEIMMQVRKEIADHIEDKDNIERFKELLQPDELKTQYGVKDFKGYIKLVRSNAATKGIGARGWGGALEAKAAAELYQRPLLLFVPPARRQDLRFDSMNSLMPMEEHWQDDTISAPPIRIIHEHGNHYNVLVPLSEIPPDSQARVGA